ncbi:hypothetical protein MMC10_005904 [Thelotrema lepadinum]|nr:hypothetical protein [Thelotrema lepadinum]
MSGDNGDGTGYSNANRAFLQAFIARSTFTFQEAQPVLAAILTAHEGRETQPGDVTETDFSSFVSTANDAIAPFDLEIRSAYHQLTRKRIYAFVNSASDPITQLATSFTPDEISFVKRVFDAMFETNNTPRHEVMAIKPIQATRLHKPPSSRRETQDGVETQGSGSQGITMLQAERVLKSLIEQGWFEKSNKSYYSLSPRALMELRGWLIETYNEDESEEEGRQSRPQRIKMCHACKEIITTGQRCAKRSCQCRIHDICTQNLFRIQKSRKCPSCKTDWSGEDFVGERAAPDTSNRRSSHGAGSSDRPAAREEAVNGSGVGEANNDLDGSSD